jgi:hypothetical protein
MVGAGTSVGSNSDAFNFIHADFLAASVLELHGASWKVIRQGDGIFQNVATLEVGCDVSVAEAVVAQLFLDPGRVRPLLDHQESIGLG